MTGKSIQDFIKDLYYNPETEFSYRQERYIISGYINSDNTLYTLEIWSTENDRQIFSCTNASREYCVEKFESAKIFNGKTIYEAENDIAIQYG